MNEETTHDQREASERQYDQLARRFNEIYLSAKERGREAMDRAMEKAKADLVNAKAFTEERGERLRQQLSSDLDQTMVAVRKLGDKARKRFDPARLEAGALSSLVSVLEATGKAMQDLGDKAREKLTVQTGQITSAGTLVCTNCGQTVHLKHTGHVPPCPKCHGTTFTKTF